MRSALRFGLVCLLLLPASLWLHAALAADYQAWVVGAANGVLEHLAPLLQIEVDADGGWRIFRQHAHGLRTFHYGMRAEALQLLFVNLALLPPLLLATPGGLATRTRRLAVGLVLLFGLHVLAVTGLAHTWRCAAVGPAYGACALTRAGLKVSGQLFAVVLWVLLTWDAWLPALRGARAQDAG